MKKIIFQMSLLALLIGMKIGLCSYTCPGGCNQSQVTTCPFKVSCTDNTGTGLIPTTAGYIDFSQPQTYAGWVYQFQVTSDVFCQTLTISNGQNAGLVLSPTVVQLYMVSGEPYSVNVTITGPCGYQNAGDQWTFTGNEGSNFGNECSLTNVQLQIPIDGSNNGGC